jgi:hypothetical protein
VQLYNAMLRRYPADVFSRFEEGGNRCGARGSRSRYIALFGKYPVPTSLLSNFADPKQAV